MAYADSWKAVIQRFKAFCDGHYLFVVDSNGNKPFTHGQIDVADILKDGRYPLMHVTPTGRRWDRAEKKRYFDCEIMFADLPFSEGSSNKPKQDEVNEVLSDTARLCEDLLGTIANSNAPFERGIFGIESATATPFIDEQSNMLSGHILSLTLSVPYNWSACDVPGSFNLNVGSDGSGGSTSPQYLKSIAVDGQQTVSATQAADTFEFVAGTNITITTNPTTKQITFTVASFATVASVTAETNARIAADLALANAITAEALSRSNADTTLQNNINAEATTRGNADTTLQTNIDAQDKTRNLYALLGGSIKAEPCGLTLANITSAGALSDGVLRLLPVYLPKAATITGVKWYQSAQGSYTADNYNGVGLYTYSSGTLTLVASSTNDGNIWKGTANTVQSKAFSSSYVALAGVYFIGALYNQSGLVTNPTIGVGLTMTNAGVVAGDFTNSAKLSSTVAAQAVLPDPQAMGGTTANTTNFYFGLY